MTCKWLEKARKRNKLQSLEKFALGSGITRDYYVGPAATLSDALRGKAGNWKTKGTSKRKKESEKQKKVSKTKWKNEGLRLKAKRRDRKQKSGIKMRN